MTCRFCRAKAIAIFALDRGCFCYPNDREQALCPQHIISATPLNTMKLLKVLDAELWTWFIESRKMCSGIANAPDASLVKRS